MYELHRSYGNILDISTFIFLGFSNVTAVLGQHVFLHSKIIMIGRDGDQIHQYFIKHCRRYLLFYGIWKNKACLPVSIHR